ncbi:MAG: hypothetical protein H6606_07380 [Flavobacteriales bacterium]|nr:hypothetical protein [Flavobacteriales bacterium]
MQKINLANTRTKLLRMPLVMALFIGATISLSGCSPSEDINHEKVDEETKSYTFFKSGSQWVYRESSSLQIDTLNVFNHSFHVAYDKEFHKNEYDNYSYQVRSSLFKQVDSNASIDVWIQPFFSDQLEEHSVARFKNPTFPLFEEIQYAGFTDTSVKYPLLIPESIRLKNIYDSLVVGDSLYFSVKHFIIEDIKHATLTKEVYWAKGVGKIRYILGNGQDWNLISHNVNQ